MFCKMADMIGMIISLLYTRFMLVVWAVSSYTVQCVHMVVLGNNFKKIILTTCHIALLLLQDTGIIVQQLIYVDPAWICFMSLFQTKYNIMLQIFNILIDWFLYNTNRAISRTCIFIMRTCLQRIHCVGSAMITLHRVINTQPLQTVVHYELL